MPTEERPSTTLIDAQNSLASPHESQNLTLRLAWQTKAPSYIREYHVGVSLPSRNVPSSNATMVQATSITYTLSKVLSCDRLSPQHHAFIISLSTEKKPTSFEQAVCDPKWYFAMEQNLQHSKLMEHGLFKNLHPRRNQLEANGYTVY